MPVYCPKVRRSKHGSGACITVKYLTRWVSWIYQVFPEWGLAIITETAKTFPLIFRGYVPTEVDAYIENLITKHQVLIDEIESLRAQLKESRDEAAGLRVEVAILTDEVAALTDAAA
jgi:DivIVA domain-containing protein